jgi:hypothetical protein
MRSRAVPGPKIRVWGIQTCHLPDLGHPPEGCVHIDPSPKKKRRTGAPSDVYFVSILLVRLVEHLGDRTVSDALKYGPEGPPPRKATVVLASAEVSYIADRLPEIKWTGLETAREAKAKRKQRELLTKKTQHNSRGGPHAVQGGLPELGRRR